MANESAVCINCNQVIKDGLMKSNFRTPPELNGLINTILDLHTEHYCDRCVIEKLNEIKKIQRKNEDYINTNINMIPIVTTHSPLGWKYRSIGIVSGQCVQGTGLISEFKSSFTDIFGLKSGSFTAKISEGERDCFFQMRTKTLRIGGNAIIATDIDYSELGSTKNMIMVCTAGTAVMLENADILNGVDTEIVNELINNARKIELIEELFKNYTKYNNL